jgi:hypothetical protein
MLLLSNPMDSIDVRYLFLMPLQTDAVSELSFDTPKGAPYFYDLTIKRAHIQQEKIILENIPVTIHRQLWDGYIQIAVCNFTLQNPLIADASARLNSIQSQIKGYLKKSIKGKESEVFEEYTILPILYKGNKPVGFVNEHREALAKLLRPLDKPLGTDEIKETLSTRVTYSDRDLTIIDWNGAVLVTDDNDINSDVELLTIGNYQLVRYRMLDREIEKKLAQLRGLVTKKELPWFSKERQRISEMVNQRLDILLNFEKIDQSLLLIGDWYTAKLYRAIVDEYYIDEWKNTVSKKLESLGSISEIITQSLSFSWERFWDQIQLTGWFILLVGYFVLFYLDFSRRK